MCGWKGDGSASCDGGCRGVLRADGCACMVWRPRCGTRPALCERLVRSGETLEIKVMQGALRAGTGWGEWRKESVGDVGGAMLGG